jgi:proteasome beta subunit
MKKLYPAVSDADSALKVAIESLYDAADDDSATGGPDLVRGIFPTAVTIGADGAQEVSGELVERLARDVIAARTRIDEFGPGSGPSNVAPRADS